MNYLAGVHIAWTAIYLFLGVYFALLGGERRVRVEFSLFGLVALSNAAYNLARVFGQDIPGARWLFWQELGFAAGVWVIAPLLDLVLRLTGKRERHPRLVALVWGYAALMVVLSFGGALLNGERVLRVVEVGQVSLTYLNSHLTILGSLALPPLLGAFAFAGYTMARSALHGSPWRRQIAVSLAIWTLSALFDAVTGALHLNVVYVAEHAAIAFMFTVSYALVAGVTEEARAQETELRRTREALSSVRETLAQKEHLAAVGELSAIIAHEVRNPLGAITNAAASLRRESTSASDRALLTGIVLEECDRLNRIVKDLLTLARPLDLQRRAADPQELLSRALGPARRAKVELDVRVAPDADAPIYCDATLLLQALENVVDNAVNAMGDDGALTVALRRAVHEGVDGREFVVIDSGPGMNTEVRNNARRAFFTTRANGTGLGLAIVDRILTTHHGALAIDSRPGFGTTVRLFVPDGRPSEPTGE